MAFVKGQSIICIADDWVNACGMICARRGVIYTVRSVSEHGIQLEEIINQPQMTYCGMVERFMDPIAFRPLVARKLPKCLTALLDVSTHKPIHESALTRESIA